MIYVLNDVKKQQIENATLVDRQYCGTVSEQYHHRNAVTIQAFNNTTIDVLRIDTFFSFSLLLLLSYFCCNTYNIIYSSVTTLFLQQKSAFTGLKVRKLRRVQLKYRYLPFDFSEEPSDSGIKNRLSDGHTEVQFCFERS